MPFTDVGVSFAPAVLLLDESRGVTRDKARRTGFSGARGNNRKRMESGEFQRVFASEGGHVRNKNSWKLQL
jgi:hypothetical protein